MADRILVTGATGFVGTALCRYLMDAGYRVRAAGRGQNRLASSPVREWTASGNIDATTDWRESLRDVHTVIHLAARVHQLRDRATDPPGAFRQVNTLGTIRLAEQAVDAGVRRFILVSTIKVNGERTAHRPFTEADPPAPQDPYGLSKAEAEARLQALARGTAMEWTIVRPPLIYGPGVKGNLLRLLDLIERGIPLPLGNLANRRSLLALDNLCHFLALCITRPEAAGEVFLVADGQPVSTSQIVAFLARGMGRPLRLWPLPAGPVRTLARLIGRQQAADRLLGSLEIDIAKAASLLDWQPVVTPQVALAEVGHWYHCRREHTGRGG